MRAFLAIDCDDRLKDNISSLIKRLDRGGGNVRWIKKQGMHLTLKFLGNITDLQAQSIDQELRMLKNSFNPFDLSLRGTGRFPASSRFPKVLWVGVDGNDILGSLHREIEQSLSRQGFPKEKRPFHPHLTLGRVKNNNALEHVLSGLDLTKDEFFGRMTVDKCTLFKSTLKPSGAEYTVLAEFPFK